MTATLQEPLLATLPGDDIRQIQWRITDRFDLQMLIQSTRSVARGVVAQLVASGERANHEWTPGKQQMLEAFDQAGVTAAFMEPSQGGYIEGPKNVALAMIAFELSWVDAGAATCSLANNLALEPIHEKGTPEQIQKYMSGAVPPQPGEERETLRGSFVLTEPLPYVGVDAAAINGKVGIAEWKDGEEPMLQIDKRGRFITNMGYANFVTAAVDSADERFRGSCMVILHEEDEGTYDRGAPTLKMVHQLSSTRDPIFSQKVPANRIIGGYTIQDGKVVPNCSHAEIIEATFRRTRVTVALMSAAKLLSAVEPVIRYHRNRYRGAEGGDPDSQRYLMGIQQKEDPAQRLVDVWATGEAATSLGFSTARLFDRYDLAEKNSNELLAKAGVVGPRARMKALRQANKDAIEYVELIHAPESERNEARITELEKDIHVKFLVDDALAMVLCPASKLYNPKECARWMREAISLVGGYGITEDCPGFLFQKWNDIQLEATYEGPEAVQRRQLSVTMINELFLKQFGYWIEDLRSIHAENPGIGAAALAAGMELWLATLRYLKKNKDVDGKKLYHGNRQGVTFSMADALSELLAGRAMLEDTLELKKKGPENPILAEGLEGSVQFYEDMTFVLAARVAAEASNFCSELVFGYQTEVPDFAAEFNTLRGKFDASLAGVRLAKDRAGRSITNVMIPEALDYPQ